MMIHDWDYRKKYYFEFWISLNILLNILKNMGMGQNNSKPIKLTYWGNIHPLTSYD